MLLMEEIMNIEKKENGSTLNITVSGRLDTGTSPQLDAEIKQSILNVTRLVIDMTGLDYISSAGLRVLLSAQKIMNRQGEMIVKGANESIMEVFEITGFTELLTLEP